MTTQQNHVAPEVRAAIAAFLGHCQTEARPFASEEAIGAVRNIFPGLGMTDEDLLDAIVGEATAAGFSVDGPVIKPARTTKQTASLERWDNEGGAIRNRALASERRERSAGTARRAHDDKARNELL